MSLSIVEIKVYQIDIPVKKARSCNGGRTKATVMDSTIVEIITDTGISGLGEVCPFPGLIPTFAEGARTAIRKLAQVLLGLNPLEIENIRATMDKELQGHQYAKTPLDVACWDILGKYSNLPLYMLLGGRFGNEFEMYHPIPYDTPKSMAEYTRELKEYGYKCFQFKIGGKPADDIERIKACCQELEADDRATADANTGWLTYEAVKVADGVRDCDVFLEQPCPTYEECMKVRGQTRLPFILDECIHGLSDVLRVFKDDADVALTLKLSKCGGITPMKQCRDLCVKLGIPMKIDTAWGSEITQSVLSHMAQSTPEQYRLFVACVSDFNAVQVADGLPTIHGGHMSASEKPGLGLTLKHDVI